jgi:hypothetical protein
MMKNLIQQLARWASERDSFGSLVRTGSFTQNDDSGFGESIPGWYRRDVFERTFPTAGTRKLAELLAGFSVWR